LENESWARPPKLGKQTSDHIADWYIKEIKGLLVPRRFPDCWGERSAKRNVGDIQKIKGIDLAA